jgi:NADH-quinone oxidoreductase subunit J
MLLIVVYVGAIAVLFLFVVMMLDIDQRQIKSKIKEYFNIFALLGVVLFAEIFMVMKASVINPPQAMPKFPMSIEISNAKAIGNVLYTDFMLPFQMAGAILFVAMIGAIVLTIREQTRFIRKQDISKQVTRTKDESVALVQVKSGEGLDI